MKHIENSDILLKYHFSNGLLMLPFFRYDLMRKNNPVESAPSGNFSTGSFAKLKSLVRNLRKTRLSEAKYVFFTSTYFNVQDKDGKYRNSLDGYYYDLVSDKSLIVEDSSSEFTWRSPTIYNHVSYVRSYYNLIASYYAKIYARLPFTKNDIAEFAEVTGLTIRNVKYIDGFVRFITYFYRRMLINISPSAIFVNCGSYGMDYSILIKVAHELKVKVIELQHGSIDENHLAYHADDHVVNSEEYNMYLPDEMWLFGQYWASNIDWRYNKKIVGNAYLNDKISNLKPQNDDYTFLLIAQPEVEQEICEFTKELALLFPNNTILLRLHPRDKKANYVARLKSIKNIDYSASSSILYEDINKSKYIIGVFSTCLYEAIALGKNPIIIDCPSSRKRFPNNIGVWSKDARSIDFEKVNKKPAVSSQMLWADDFENTAKDLLMSI